ncbi:MAG: Ig-like domain-containing protein [Ruminococcus sp.]|nr:Ig-like domain-containing protein [Candidatus Copronaster equi]
MKKKIISILLTITMLIGIIPLGVFTAFAKETEYKEPLVIERSTTISDMTISGNYDGSAIVITGNASDVNFENVTFENISSNGDGSCIYIDIDDNRQARYNFTNCRFINCSCEDRGGAIYIKSDNVNIGFENTVASNCSSTMGGFLHIDGINTWVDGNDSTLIKDCSSVFGGAISVNGKNVESGVLIENLNFVSNQSRNQGGAVYVSAFAKNVLVKFCDFYSNGAGISGGAAYADFNASMEIFACLFYDNFADINGEETSAVKTVIPTFICDKEQCAKENHIKFGTNTSFEHTSTSGYTLKKSNDGKYHINNNEDWFSFYRDVNIIGKDFAGETVVLESDIAAYKPIGSYADNKKFKGIFDGNGHTVNYSDTNADTSDKGVFSATEGATIRNLYANGILKGKYSLGGIVGNAVATSFRNCKSYAVINGTESYGGGIVGCSSYDCTYFNCTNFGNIKMKMKAGGIIGRARPNTVILNALNFGNVNGEQYISGLIGYEDGENSEGYEGKAVTVGNAHILGNVTASVSDAYAVTGRAISGSVYELCLYNEDGCPADSRGIGVSQASLYGKDTDTIDGEEFIMPNYVNDYITQNSKNTQRWLYMEIEKDGAPYFISNINYDYTVTFSVPKGVAAISAKKVIDGDTVILPTAENIGDYTFYGWATEEIDTESTEKPAVLTEEYIPTGSITLYAVYTRVKGDVTCYTSLPCLHENTSIVGAKEPSCIIPGYTGDTVCDDCGETVSFGEDIPAPGQHDYSYQITKEPTCVLNGIGVYTCSRCKVSYEETIPKTGIHSWVSYDNKIHKCENCNAEASHTYVNGECVCGRKEPGTDEDYFYIKNTGSDIATVTWKDAEFDTVVNLEYSINNKYSFAKFDGTVELNAGDVCYFRGWNNNLNNDRVVCNTPNASLAVGGDIGTLLNEIGNMTEYPEIAFANVFLNLKALTDISDLTLCNENTKLARACFAGMFGGCSGLTEIPDNFLHATKLAESCYKLMFDRCTSLKTIPDNLLPAKELEDSCYENMFSGCTLLKTVPDNLLPAEDLADSCYCNMFWDCENLTYAPDLPAKQLCYGCYSGMFNGCQNLSRIKVSFTEWGDGYNYETRFFLPSEINDTLTIFCPSTLDTVSRGIDCIQEGTYVNIVYFSEILLAAAGGTGGTASVSAIPGRALPDITVPVREGFAFDGYYDINGVKYYDIYGKGTKVWNKTDVSVVLIAIWTVHEHTFSSSWTYDEIKHWHDATCKHSSFTSGLAEHNYIKTEDSFGNISYVCSECGYTMSADKKVSKITINSNKEVLLIGDTVALTATVLPDTAENKTVKWTSLDTNIATVVDGVVTAKCAGSTVIIAETVDGGYKDFCLIRVAGITPKSNTTAVVDYDNGIISGIAPKLDNLDSFIEISEDGLTLTYSTETIGTGTVVNVIRNGEVIDAYTTILFGDVNHDGIYDGMDAVTVSMLATGMLTKEQVGEAVYMAADCNHDGIIDEFDVDLLEQAGVLLANVDQSKTLEELKSDSVYVEYLNLIEQNPVNEEIQPEQTSSALDKLIGFIAGIYAFLNNLINFIKNFFA